MRSEGVESIYWAGTESGFMDIYNFPGVIYATDGGLLREDFTLGTHQGPMLPFHRLSGYVWRIPNWST